MHEITQPSIAFRLIFATIDGADTLVQNTADIYNDARVVILNAGDWIDHFATILPACLRRPLARTASFLARALFAVTDRICRLRLAHLQQGRGPRLAPSRTPLLDQPG